MEIKSQLYQIFNNRNFRHGALYTVFSFINSGISFILLLILAKYLSPFDYGQLNLLTTFVSLISILISLCTTSYIAVCFFQKDNETLKKIIYIAFATTTVMLLVISGFILLFPKLITSIIGVPISYIWLGLMICYFQVFNSVNLDIWRLEEKPISYGLYGVSFAVCNFVLSFWLVVGLKLGWEGRVYAWWLLALLYFIISFIFLIKRRYLVITKPDFSLIKETIAYSIPLIPHTASFWMKQGLDRYILNYFYDQSIVGYFSFAATLASIIMLIGTAFNSTNSVYIYKKLAEGYIKAKEKLSKQTMLMSVVFIVVSIVVMLFASVLILFVIPNYSESIQYIIPLCLGGFFQCLYFLWVNYLFFYKRTQSLMCITVSTAVLQFLLSLWLTRYSPIFTAYVSMFISLITTILVYLLSKKFLSRINT